MTTLDRYLGIRLFSAFLKALVALVLLYVFFDLTTHRSGQIIERNVPWHIVGIYYLAQIPFIISEYQVAALATLVAGLIVFGNAAQNNEVVAALSAGISLRRLMRAPALIVLIICIAVFTVQETIGIRGAETSSYIEDHYYMGNPNAERPGISWSNLPDDWTCHILKFNRTAMTGENVVLLRYTPAEIERIRARRIYWEPKQNAWLLEDGLWSRFDPAQGMQSTHRRITQTPAPLAERPEDLFATESHPATLKLPQLRENLARAERYGLPTNQVEVDLHMKLARPFLPFVMLWLAAPFALRIRRGGIATAFGISIAIGLTYLLAFVLAQAMGDLGHIPPAAAAWGPNAAYLAIGATLFLRTPS